MSVASVAAGSRLMSMFIGVVSDGKLDGDDDAPVMIEAAQVGAERAASVVVAVVVRRGSVVTAIPVAIIVAVGWGERR